MHVQCCRCKEYEKLVEEVRSYLKAVDHYAFEKRRSDTYQPDIDKAYDRLDSQRDVLEKLCGIHSWY